jgi:extradiol dioxygenase family protein
VQLELICRKDGRVPKAEGPVAHICLKVTGIDQLVVNLKAKGVAFDSEKPAVLTGDFSGIKNIFLAGPGGEKLEFFDYGD